MHTKMLTLLACLLLIWLSPAIASAHPEHGQSGEQNRQDHHHHKHPQVDWTSAPADIQALKVRLDELRGEQKLLFEQMMQQRSKIKSTQEMLTENKRQTVKTEAKDLVKQMHDARETMRTLRDQTHAAWDQFYVHSQAKQWAAAKSDLNTIIARKQEVIVQQKSILKTQQKVVELMTK